MEKIPTAEEFIKNLDVAYVNKLSENEIAEITFQMVKFAKLHVKAALETASEKALGEYKTELKPNYNLKGEFIHNIEDSFVEIDKDSILHAYPEDNIK